MSRKTKLSNETENDIFAERLREAMKMRGENQSSLAAKISKKYGSIQRQTISLYAQGQSKPDTERLTAICKALDVSADYLLGLSPAASRDPELQAVAKYTGLSEDAIKNIKECADLFDDDLLSSLLSSWDFMEIIAALGDLRECITLFKEAEKLAASPEVITIQEALKEFGRMAEVAKTSINDERPDYVAAQLMTDLYEHARFQKYELADYWDDLVESVVPEVKLITRKRLKEGNNGKY